MAYSFSFVDNYAENYAENLYYKVNRSTVLRVKV